MDERARELALQRWRGWGTFFFLLSIPISGGAGIAAGRFVAGEERVTAYGIAAFLVVGSLAWAGVQLLGDAVMKRVAPHPDDPGGS